MTTRKLEMKKKGSTKKKVKSVRLSDLTRHRNKNFFVQDIENLSNKELGEIIRRILELSKIQDSFNNNSEFEKFINKNAKHIRLLVENIVDHPPLSEHIDRIWVETMSKDYLKGVLRGSIYAIVVKQLERDFIVLNNLKTLITDISSIKKIDANYIFYDIKKGELFVDYKNLKSYLMDISYVLNMLFVLIFTMNYNLKELFVEHIRDDNDIKLQNSLQTEIIQTILELIEKNKKVTQKNIANHLGKNRTTFIEQCKREKINLSALIKQYKAH